MAHVYSAMFVVCVDYLAPKSYSGFHLIGGFEGFGTFKGCYSFFLVGTRALQE